LRCQSGGFFDGELEAEIAKKPLKIAFHRLVEPEGGHAIKPRQIGIQDDPLAANLSQQRLDRFQHGWLRGFLCHSWSHP